MSKKIVIVGGVAGGASFAARMRRLDEEAEITMFEKGTYISFANCGLPYHIGEIIPQRDTLILQTPEAMEKKFNMTIHTETEVTSINRKEKTISYQHANQEEIHDMPYDYLILSPGASPLTPPIPGLNEADNVYTLRTIPDMDEIKSAVEDESVQEAVIIGGGFIGLEVAENFVERGIKTTVVEMADQVMAPLDKEMAQQVHEHLVDQGVKLILDDGINSFEDRGKTLVLNSGRKLSTDFTLLSIGVRPENQLAKDAGLSLGQRGGILVNDDLRTVDDESIFAIGDAIEVKDYISGTPAMIPLAWPANRQGRMAADNIAGANDHYRGSLGTSAAKIFDLTVATVGNNEKLLQRQGRDDYEVMHIHPSSHASYYPGAFPMHIKVLYSRDSKKILGAQAIGYDAVDKFIDIMATAIYGEIPVDQLQNLQLAYAPPYSSAKSPANFVGYVAENRINDKDETIQWHEIDDYVDRGYYLLDVSEREENIMGEIPGSVNIPVGELRQRLSELEKKPYIVYCRVGLRGYIGARILRQHGFDVVNLDGGFKTWQYTQYELKDPVYWDHQPEKPSAEAPKSTAAVSNEPAKVVEINACGLQCPGPIMQVYKAMNDLNDGDQLQISVTDPGFTKDIQSWCEKTGNQVFDIEKQDKQFVCLIQKGQGDHAVNFNQGAENAPVAQTVDKEAATLVVFSGDMDKAMASFIIASGAAAMGKQVTIFFTFWGLSIIKKDNVQVKKSSMEKMFDMMLPNDASSLPLSKMNMAGMGRSMMKKVMAEKNVDSLETLMKSAQEVGVKFIACAMSMDVMGIKEEELIDGVEVGGVATYLGEASDSNINLFI